MWRITREAPPPWITLNVESGNRGRNCALVGQILKAPIPQAAGRAVHLVSADLVRQVFRRLVRVGIHAEMAALADRHIVAFSLCRNHLCRPFCSKVF